MATISTLTTGCTSNTQGAAPGTTQATPAQTQTAKPNPTVTPWRGEYPYFTSLADITAAAQDWGVGHFWFDNVDGTVPPTANEDPRLEALNDIALTIPKEVYFALGSFFRQGFSIEFGGEGYLYFADTKARLDGERGYPTELERSTLVPGAHRRAAINHDTLFISPDADPDDISTGMGMGIGLALTHSTEQTYGSEWLTQRALDEGIMQEDDPGWRDSVLPTEAKAAYLVGSVLAKARRNGSMGGPTYEKVSGLLVQAIVEGTPTPQEVARFREIVEALTDDPLVYTHLVGKQQKSEPAPTDLPSFTPAAVAPKRSSWARCMMAARSVARKCHNAPRPTARTA